MSRSALELARPPRYGASPLDGPPSPTFPWWSGTASALTHGLLGAIALSLPAAHTPVDRAVLAATQMVEVTLDPALELASSTEAAQDPTPPRASREPAPRAKPRPAAAAKPTPAAVRAAPPPAAAAPARVLSRVPAPKEVMDFGDTVVLGAAESYLGGVTAAGGTSSRPTGDGRARAHGVEGSRGGPAAAQSRSRPPSLAQGGRWDCPFPREADMAGIDDGVVTLRVSVTAGGSVRQVLVEQEPGHGFGREARRCAMQKRWRAGLDRDGSPVSAVAQVRVRFTRP